MILPCLGHQLLRLGAACLASLALALTGTAVTLELGNGFRDHGVATPISNHRGIVSTVDGQGRDVVLVWLFDNTGGYALLLIDAVTGKSEQYNVPFPPGGDCPYASILSSSNKFYTHFNGYFTEFDPVKRAFTFTRSTYRQMAMGMTEDDNGVIWSVTYPNSGVVSYNPKTGEFRDFGSVYSQNWQQYQRYVAADDTGWIYIALGNTASQLLSFNPATGKATAILPTAERKTGTAYLYRDLDGKVYGQALSGDANSWYEMYQGNARKIGTHPVSRAKPIITGNQALVYTSFPSGRRLKSCNLVDRLLTVVEPDGKNEKTMPFDYTSEGAGIMSVAASPDGTICGGTMFPMRFFSYNPVTDTWVNQAAYGQFNTLVRQGDRVFYGGYPGGFLLEHVPAQPWVATVKNNNACNPRYLTECTPTIHRPHKLLAHPDDKTIILSGTPEYGYTGGGLFIWNRDTQSGTLLKHTDILTDHSTYSMAALPNGKLLAGTTTAAGTGGEVKAKVAELYIMDLATRKLDWHSAVFPGVQQYTDLYRTSSGLIYGIADRKKFFVFDATTRTVVLEQNIEPQFGLTPSPQGPRLFIAGPQNELYLLLVKGVARINQTNHSLTLLATAPVTIDAGGDYLNGRIYYTCDSRLCSYQLPLDEAQRVAQQTAAAAAVRRVLAAARPAPASPPGAARLLDAALQPPRLTLNFSRELLDFGLGSPNFEQLSRQLHFAVGEVLRDTLLEYDVFSQIEGVPLHQILAAAEGPAAPRAEVVPRRIVVNPGHGYYWNGTAWSLQQSPVSGVSEDFVNHDIASLLHSSLTGVGADVRPTRNLDRAAGLGESGQPKWQEAARYYLKALGADALVWNEAGFAHLEQDLRCRPRFASACGADLLVSLHAGSGGGSGTATLYDSSHASSADSRRLANIVHARVVAAIRRDFDSAWVDRRVQGYNGNYTENRLAPRPAILLEIAFLDRATPDQAALQSDAFKQIVAQAIRDGLVEYYAGPATAAPSAPTRLLATGEADAIALSWTDQSSNEAGFTIERREDTAGTWQALGGVVANATSYTDTTASRGVAYRYRLFAFNAAGKSTASSNEATAALLTQLTIANVTPATPATRSWGQETVFTLTVADQNGKPLPGATVCGHDSLRQSAIATAATDANGQTIYRCVVPEGQANGSHALSFTATKSLCADSAVVTRTIAVSQTGVSPTGAPTILLQPAPQTSTHGQSVTLTVSAQGASSLSYQWLRDGQPLAGATAANLTLKDLTAADAGAYSVTVANALGRVTSLAAPLTLRPAAWLTNLSLRTTLLADQSVIVGFVVEGGSRALLLRAAGPALASFVAGPVLTDPQLKLYRSDTCIADNNDWPFALAATHTALGAFDFTRASRDAALCQELIGSHTLLASGAGSGMLLVESYDAGGTATGRLVNLSSRHRVGTGDGILIAGFTIAGSGKLRVLVRAIGPTLADWGVPSPLADPQLEVHGPGGRLAGNDNWDAALVPSFAQAGAFALPGGSRDAALVLSVDAGSSYTAQVSGVAGSTGEALVEVYALP
ncbi:MAG: N-acetylmuramoyl-L-alanine amidase [Opitutae bacterium]|nr:N-acetylmuramoyl-L-alanine amidase [Opitutae bacterium]